MLSSPQVSFAWLRLGLFVIIASVLSFAGCVSEMATVAEPPATCTKVGDSCTFSPGKLGLCVESANDSSVLVCQSQH
jgi:hypothetical protein